LDGFFIILVIGAIAVGVIHASKQKKRANAAWADVARRNGMRHSPGSWMSQPSMRGHVDGYLVSVDTVSRGGGKNSQTYTRYRIHYDKIGVKLRLTREVPVMSALGKMFGGQDHEVGDKAFDDKVVVRGPSEARAREYLTEPRRRAIRKFLSSHKHAVITESNATFETVGLETGEGRLQRGIRLLVELAEELRSDGVGQGTAPGQKAAAAGVAAALGAVATAAPDTDTEPEPEPEPAPPWEDFDLPEAAVEEPVPDPPLEPTPEPVVAEPAPEPVAPVPPPELPPETARFEVGDSPPMPEVPSIDPDAGPPAAETEEEAMISGRQQDVCEALFVDDGGLSHAKDVFASDYDGMYVHWSGELKSARHYYSDMTFGSAPGTRAEVVVAKVASGILGEREIVAVVQLPDGAEKELKDVLGQHVTFEGDLAKVDPFMRQVFVRNASIVS
jgi:hypothetical protein